MVQIRFPESILYPNLPLNQLPYTGFRQIITSIQINHLSFLQRLQQIQHPILRIPSVRLIPHRNKILDSIHWVWLWCCHWYWSR